MEDDSYYLADAIDTQHGGKYTYGLVNLGMDKKGAYRAIKLFILMRHDGKGELYRVIEIWQGDRRNLKKTQGILSY